IDAVDVTIHVSRLESASKPALQMPIVIYNVETVAKTIEALSVTDSKGPLNLTVQDDPEGGHEYNRHWTADRMADGELSIHYRAPITNRLSPLGGAPPIEPRSDGEAFSAGGAAFLLLPETQTQHRIAVHWDLSQLPSGSVGLSSLGGGD